MNPRPLVLASSSTYRRTLLEKLRLPFVSAAPSVDESPTLDETPANLARRLAVDKARALTERFPHHLIIGSDQVATCRDELLGKPGTRERALDQLAKASGQLVRFHTAVAVLDAASGQVHAALEETGVHFRRLSSQQIARYVDLDEPYDCAGSFRSEGLGITLIERIGGDDPNALIGLPLIRLIDLLARFGVELPG